MKVVFIPDYSMNPYQNALANSLAKEGADVGFSTRFFPFAILSSIKNHWKPRILHIHWPHLFLLASGKGRTVLKSLFFISELLVLKLLGIRIVWTVHNIVNHEREHKNIELLFNKLISRLCDKLIVHCQAAKNAVMNAYGLTNDSLTEIIRHGNYINIYENKVNRTKAREQLQIDMNDIVFLNFGLIRPYKGIPNLIDSFNKIKSPKASLLIVGKPYNEKMAEIIQRRCKNKKIKTIFKFISDNEVQVYFNAADILVLPFTKNFKNQMSGVVLLAMSFGKPIITPAFGCFKEVLNNTGSFLYDPSDEEGLLKAMQNVLDKNKSDLIKMGNHNVELAKQFQWDDIAKRTYKVYFECLKKNKKK